MHSFKQLAVWRKAHDLTQRVFRTTSKVDWRQFPHLATQLQQTAFAAVYYIVEGTGRDSPAQFTDSLDAAIGSAQELEYQLLLAKDLGALETAEHARLEARVIEVHRMLGGLRRTVAARTTRAARPARRVPSR